MFCLTNFPIIILIVFFFFVLAVFISTLFWLLNPFKVHAFINVLKAANYFCKNTPSKMLQDFMTQDSENIIKSERSFLKFPRGIEE